MMDFQIRQGATLPRLYLEFSKTGYDSDFWANNDIEAASFWFSMRDEDGRYRVKCSPMNLIHSTDGCGSYYLEFAFLVPHTSKKGRYIGEVKMETTDGTFIGPVTDTLYVHVL